jgi:hypothetical protein
MLMGKREVSPLLAPATLGYVDDAPSLGGSEVRLEVECICVAQASATASFGVGLTLPRRLPVCPGERTCSR